LNLSPASTLSLVATLHIVSTVFMAGVITFVQVVHYPLMAAVGGQHFATYERSHTVRTGWVVGPPMIVELVTALWLALALSGSPSAGLAVLGLTLLGVIWASTALLQAPAHGRLVHGFDVSTHRLLVRTNWIRTLAWLARVPVALLLPV
jgi:hypothetical protein